MLVNPKYTVMKKKTHSTQQKILRTSLFANDTIITMK